MITRRFFTFCLITVLGISGLPIPPILAADNPDATFSRISITKTTVKADGIDNTVISLTMRDANITPIENATVILMSSRGSLDEIIAEQPITNSLGQARFAVRSLKDGTSTFTARIGDYVLNKSVSVTFQGGLTFPLQVGDLIKIPDDGNGKTLNDTAVYYYALNGKRYVFPNEKTYGTWYNDFSRVKVIPLDQMSLIPIGGNNVTYRPGTRMVKFQTDPKTYLVTKGGVLRWVRTEAIARDLFGESWNRQIDDISEAFYVNYRFGTPLDNALDAPLDLIRSSVQNIDQDQGLVSTKFP